METYIALFHPMYPMDTERKTAYIKTFKKGKLHMKFLYQIEKTVYLKKAKCAETTNNGLMIETYERDTNHYYFIMPLEAALTFIKKLGKNNYIDLTSYELDFSAPYNVNPFA